MNILLLVQGIIYIERDILTPCTKILLALNTRKRMYNHFVFGRAEEFVLPRGRFSIISYMLLISINE